MLRLIAVGDIAFDAPPGANPLGGIVDMLRGGALVFGNLETVLSDREEALPAEKHYVFKAPASYATLLADAGFDVVNLANNHILDFGPDCPLDTIAALDASGIAHVGAGRTCEEALAPAILERDGVRVGSLGAARRGLRRLAGWSP